MPNDSHALIQNDIVLFGLIAATLAFVFWTAARPSGPWKKFYGIVPPLLLCYFIPGIFNSVGLINGAASQLYNPVASRVLLPAALVLLTMTIDLKAVMRLGWRMLAMYFGASFSIMAGAFFSFWVMQRLHAATVAGDTWGGMAALAGSWIGGGANMVAMKEMFNVDATVFGQFAVLDVGVGYVWMAFLIFMAGRAGKIDAKSGADTAAIEDLKHRLADYSAQHARIPTLTDYVLIVGVAFGAVGLAHAVSPWLAGLFAPYPWAHAASLDSSYVWVVLLCTVGGLGLSFTGARKLDGVGASKIGTLLLYILIACIGMQMEIGALLDRPWLLVLAVIWITVHIVLLWGLGKLLKAPLFYFALGSQANIGGPASAPVVAAAFHPALAPVGALLGTMGYATGTVLAYLVGIGLRAMAGAG